MKKNNKAIALKKHLEQKNQKYSTFFTVCLALAAIFASVFFMFYSAKYNPISREEAAAFSGGFESYKESNSSKYDSVLYFRNGNYFYVSLSCESKEFIDHMKSLEQGATLDILVNPNNNFVIEIKKGSEELLNFDAAQKAIDSENNAYFVIGIVAFVCGIGLIVFTVMECVHKKTNRKSKQSKQPTETTNQKNSSIIRRADFNVKYKTLLDAKIDGYEICYRRVKSVNELIVNECVYDEKKGILEFEHTLVAVIDGHKIEAGLDEMSCSFITFDDELIAYKERMI